MNSNLSFFNVDYCTNHFSISDGIGNLMLNSECGTRLTSKQTFYYGYFEGLNFKSRIKN